MWLGVVGLVLWDVDRWRAVFTSETKIDVAPITPRIDMKLWTRCGIAMLVLYLGSAVVHGGVYRPRGMELDNPYFYVMPVVMLLPIITFIIDQRRQSGLRACTRPKVPNGTWGNP